VCYKGKFFLIETKNFSKSYHSSDDFLQLGNLKTESPVIVDKHATVKVVSLPRALTARHVLKVLYTGKWVILSICKKFFSISKVELFCIKKNYVL